MSEIINSSPGIATGKDISNIPGSSSKVNPSWREFAYSEENVGGLILHVQRLTRDFGPGLRTTVTLKGCALHCDWCANPQCISQKQEVIRKDRRCIHCYLCIEHCPIGALEMVGKTLIRDRQRCRTCGICVDVCPSGAHQMLGRFATVEDITKNLVEDRAHYARSNGGVTIAGGEPTRQPIFTLALLRSLRDKGIHTNLDTNATCSPETFVDIISASDMVSIDLKLMDDTAQKRHTGMGTDAIVHNLTWLASQPHKRIWVRTPLIRGVTLTETNLKAIGSFLMDIFGGRVERWEFYSHDMDIEEKYHLLDREWAYTGNLPVTPAETGLARQWAGQSGFDLQRVTVTHATRSF
ncbi:MAG: glycyl-radical enzyme activating protein [Anaerolineae bacterium]|nr:glycyl-radical enzyme activating protein [Anaerolineae bacterium]